MTALKLNSKAARAKLHHLNLIYDFFQHQPGNDGKIFLGFIFNSWVLSGLL